MSPRGVIRVPASDLDAVCFPCHNREHVKICWCPGAMAATVFPHDTYDDSLRSGRRTVAVITGRDRMLVEYPVVRAMRSAGVLPEGPNRHVPGVMIEDHGKPVLVFGLSGVLDDEVVFLALLETAEDQATVWSHATAAWVQRRRGKAAETIRAMRLEQKYLEEETNE